MLVDRVAIAVILKIVVSRGISPVQLERRVHLVREVERHGHEMSDQRRECERPSPTSRLFLCADRDPCPFHATREATTDGAMDKFYVAYSNVESVNYTNMTIAPMACSIGR